MPPTSPSSRHRGRPEFPWPSGAPSSPVCSRDVSGSIRWLPRHRGRGHNSLDARRICRHRRSTRPQGTVTIWRGSSLALPAHQPMVLIAQLRACGAVAGREATGIDDARTLQPRLRCIHSRGELLNQHPLLWRGWHSRRITSVHGRTWIGGCSARSGTTACCQRPAEGGKSRCRGARNGHDHAHGPETDQLLQSRQRGAARRRAAGERQAKRASSCRQSRDARRRR